MARKTRIRISTKAPKLTKRERDRLRKALRTAVSIMDAHDLKTITLDALTTATRARTK
jgi:hypothetical protein